MRKDQAEHTEQQEVPAFVKETKLGPIMEYLVWLSDIFKSITASMAEAEREAERERERETETETDIYIYI